MIECKKISKTYINGKVETPVLKNVSFKIDDGEYVAIIGPSGSGKSTLMHILGLLDTPTSGKLTLDGQDVSHYADDELAELRKTKIGFVFQAFNLLPRATALRNAMLPLGYNPKISTGERENIARSALRNAGLEEEFYSNLSNQLSGGQMQRVAIARSLVNDPSIIFADEPTGNLDTKTGKIVIETFNKLNKQGRTIIIITHDHGIARYADRTIAIRDGVIVSDSKNHQQL